MSSAERSRSVTAIAREVASGALICAVATLVVAAGTGAIVLFTGMAADARRELDFGFAGVARTPGEALRLSLHNGRLAAATLLCASAAPRLPRLARRFVDLLLPSLLALNAAAVGIALGAYGPRLLRAVALHLPLELVALALAGGTYMAARRESLGLAALIRVAVLCLLLLAVAATLETYLPLGGPR